VIRQLTTTAPLSHDPTPPSAGNNNSLEPPSITAHVLVSSLVPSTAFSHNVAPAQIAGELVAPTQAASPTLPPSATASPSLQWAYRIVFARAEVGKQAVNEC
ncbi:hypothetical protein FRC00_005942, partial [Tulasnella sp. 408]